VQVAGRTLAAVLLADTAKQSARAKMLRPVSEPQLTSSPVDMYMADTWAAAAMFSPVHGWTQRSTGGGRPSTSPDPLLVPLKEKAFEGDTIDDACGAVIPTPWIADGAGAPAGCTSSTDSDAITGTRRPAGGAGELAEGISCPVCGTIIPTPLGKKVGAGTEASEGGTGTDAPEVGTNNVGGGADAITVALAEEEAVSPGKADCCVLN
jgi:hypothetical protein